MKHKNFLFQVHCIYWLIGARGRPCSSWKKSLLRDW